jgi:hypothetical protein
MMAGISIRNANELYSVPKVRKLGGGTSKLNLAIVGVGSDAENSYLSRWHPSHVGVDSKVVSSSKQLQGRSVQHRTYLFSIR